MSIIYVIIAALVALDLLWWASADRLLRKAGFKRVRILHTLFFGCAARGLAHRPPFPAFGAVGLAA